MGILTNFLKLLKPEPNDFVNVAKHISENYDKLDLNAKSNNETLTNLSNNKLDKGTYPGNASDLNTEISKIASTTQLGRIIVGDNLTIDEAGRLSGKKVDLSNYYDKPEIEEKFKNFCPFPINSLFLTLGTENPATLFLGTTWEKQEGRFLLGSNSAYTLGSTGGSATTTLTKANLPSEKLQLDSFSLGRGTQEITGQFNAGGNSTNPAGKGAFSVSSSRNPGSSGNDDYAVIFNFTASKSWTGMSTSAAPYTTNMGDSTPFNNMPPYLVVNIWKRLT